MDIFRTLDERFADLPGYPFEPHYADVGEGVRMHTVDEGDGQVVLMLHGEPSWSYLYRKVIPPVVDAGFRAVAPDMIGFGRSDKPMARDAYTYRAHLDWTLAFIDALDLTDITLVCQDWGGLIGLRLLAEHPDRFARVVATNTFLPTGDIPPSPTWVSFRDATQKAEFFDVARFVKSGCKRGLDDAALNAYDAPFPTEESKAGPRQFPMLVPISPEDPETIPNRAAWESLAKFDKPFLTAFSDSDPITRGGDRFMQSTIPGCNGQPHTTIADAGHFVQEDAGEELGRIVAEFVQKT